MPEAELLVPPEKNVKFFKFEKELPDGTNLFSFNHLPHLGILSINPSAIVIPGMTFECFNPPSMEDIRKVKEGDLIQTTSNNKHEIYKAWNPPAEYQIPDGFSTMFRVRLVTKDSMDYPVIVGDAAL